MPTECNTLRLSTWNNVAVRYKIYWMPFRGEFPEEKANRLTKVYITLSMCWALWRKYCVSFFVGLPVTVLSTSSWFRILCNANECAQRVAFCSQCRAFVTFTLRVLFCCVLLALAGARLCGYDNQVSIFVKNRANCLADKPSRAVWTEMIRDQVHMCKFACISLPTRRHTRNALHALKMNKHSRLGDISIVAIVLVCVIRTTHVTYSLFFAFEEMKDADEQMDKLKPLPVSDSVSSLRSQGRFSLWKKKLLQELDDLHFIDSPSESVPSLDTRSNRFHCFVNPLSRLSNCHTLLADSSTSSNATQNSIFAVL